MTFHLRGEISTATNFEAESLVLSYCILIPNGKFKKLEKIYLFINKLITASDWSSCDENKLCGTTHFARMTKKSVGTEGKFISVAHFNQFFEAKISAPLDKGNILIGALIKFG